MADNIFRLTRRAGEAGLGAAVLRPATPSSAAAEQRPAQRLRATAGAIGLRPGEPETPIWSLGITTPGSGARFKRGDALEVTLDNDLPVPAVLDCHGIDGAPDAEPLAARAPLPPGGRQTLLVPLRHAGTFLCDLRLLGDGLARPSPARPLVVRESEAVAVDRDEVFLIEDWRLQSDGTAIAPGIDPRHTSPLYTINRQTALDIPARRHERLRLRFVNGFQRNVIAIKIPDHEVRVMALDGQPAEPFPARNGAVVLAPGSRVDVFIDATGASGSSSSILLHDGTGSRAIARLVTSDEPPVRDAPLGAAPPLPSNGLPDRLDLRNALRIDLQLGARPPDWVAPTSFENSVAPAFRARAGRTVVLALTNRADIAQVFHLHGHHFRLLDRLDDGWKPYWLDTLAIDAGQTERIAFAAEYPGRWLMETMMADWAAPRLVRCYNVQ